jgi:hypothetical protein
VTPFSFLTCIASRVRILMKSRSSSANTTATCAVPIGVRVSMPEEILGAGCSCLNHDARHRYRSFQAQTRKANRDEPSAEITPPCGRCRR